MVIWADVTYTASSKKSSTYNYQLFYHQNKKALFEVLIANQFCVEQQLDVKLNISYEDKRLYLAVETDCEFDKDTLIEDILECYEDFFENAEKFLSLIQQINFCSNGAKNYMKVIIKQDHDVVDKIFKVLERRATKLNLVAEKIYENGCSFVTLTPANNLTMGELLLQKELLLSSREVFYKQCKTVVNLPEKTVLSPAKKPKLGPTTSYRAINFPLSQASTYQVPSHSNSRLWFKEDSFSRVQPKKSTEIINLVEEDKSSMLMEEFRSQVGNEGGFTLEELKAINVAENMGKRKAETEIYATYKVQKTVDQSPQGNHPDSLGEIEDFINGFNLQP